MPKDKVIANVQETKMKLINSLESEMPAHENAGRKLLSFYSLNKTRGDVAMYCSLLCKHPCCKGTISMQHLQAVASR